MDSDRCWGHSLVVAPQPVWWHDLTIIVIARVMLLNLAAFIGLLLAEGAAAALIDGHTPVWGAVGKACFAFGMAVTEIACLFVLLHAPSRRSIDESVAGDVPSR